MQHHHSVREQVAQILADPINLPSAFLDYLLQYAALNPIPTGAVNAPILSSTGLTGATKSSRLVGSTTAGAPTQGTFALGDLVIAQDGHVWICTLAGSPGTWVDASVSPLQAAAAVTFSGDVHLTTAGNTIEQAGILTLKAVVSDPTVAPTISVSGAGQISGGSSTNYYGFVCYTWVDGSGHESAPSPVSNALNLPPVGHAHISIAVSIPTIPGGATGFHVYGISQVGSTPPAASTLKRQAATSYISSETVSPTIWSLENTSGANPPGATNFPTGTSATIKDASGNTLISGDGTVRMPTSAADKSSSTLQAFTAGISSAHSSQGIGYATGAGGTVTQTTDKTTAVTLNKITGQVTMNNASLASGASVNFLVNNSTVGTNDCVVANIIGPSGTSGSYSMSVPHVSNGGGGFRLFVTNTSGGSLSDALVISFAVIKAATS